MSSEQYTVERFLEYVRTSRSKNTLVMYKEGLKRFTEWYGKTANEILEERVSDWTSGDLFKKKRFAREIEKFHSHLIKERGYSPNSATYYCQGIRALFSFYEMPVKVSSEIDKRVMTSRDYVPRIDQYAEMFRVADNLRDKLIVSMGLTLAWRIGDFAKLKKSDLPNLDLEPPIPFEILSEKEDVVAKSFLSDEAVELLKQYLPTTPEGNLYLFPSNGKGHLDHTTFNRIVRELANGAKIRTPKGKRIRFHCFRKRFLSEAANLTIDVNIAKILVGKAVEPAMLAYLSEIDLKEAFTKISGRLTLTAKPMRRTRKTATELERQLRSLEMKLNVIGNLAPDLMKKVDALVENAESYRMTKDKWKIKDMTFNEKLDILAKEELRKQRKEYARIIAENNNNNH